MFVIYDLEFTTWPGAQERGWTAPGEFREIVQIGALRVDGGTLEVEAEFDVLVRPVRNPRLSPYFEALTGITEDHLAARGQDFASAYNAFLKFCNGNYAVSYGNDMVVIGENLILQFPPGETPAAPSPSFLNIRPHLNARIPATRGLSAGELHDGLDDEDGEGPRGPSHNALVDCYGIVEALRYLRRRGEPLFAL